MSRLVPINASTNTEGTTMTTRTNGKRFMHGGRGACVGAALVGLAACGAPRLNVPPPAAAEWEGRVKACRENWNTQRACEEKLWFASGVYWLDGEAARYDARGLWVSPGFGTHKLFDEPLFSEQNGERSYTTGQEPRRDWELLADAMKVLPAGPEERACFDRAIDEFATTHGGPIRSDEDDSQARYRINEVTKVVNNARAAVDEQRVAQRWALDGDSRYSSFLDLKTGKVESGPGEADRRDFAALGLVVGRFPSTLTEARRVEHCPALDWGGRGWSRIDDGKCWPVIVEPACRRFVARAVLSLRDRSRAAAAARAEETVKQKAMAARQEVLDRRFSPILAACGSEPTCAERCASLEGLSEEELNQCRQKSADELGAIARRREEEARRREEAARRRAEEERRAIEAAARRDEEQARRYREEREAAAAEASRASAAQAAAAKKKADDIAACEAACLKQKKPEAVCKRICAQ